MVIEAFNRAAVGLSDRVEKLHESFKNWAEVQKRVAKEVELKLSTADAFKMQKRHDRQMLILAGLIVVQIAVTIGARLIH